MIRASSIFIVVLFLFSCVSNPPTQEMSDARQTIEDTKTQIIESQVTRSDKAYLILDKARKLLDKAKEHLDKKDYQKAKIFALDAKKMANLASEQLKQSLIKKY
jgi:hypothetical protein